MGESCGLLGDNLLSLVSLEYPEGTGFGDGHIALVDLVLPGRLGKGETGGTGKP